MARTLSTTAKRAIFSQETAEVFLTLLTISHPELETALRFVDNTVNILSRGSTYLGCPFQISLPDDLDSAPPRITLKIDAVDQQVIAAVRGIVTPATLTLEIVLASDPDTVEANIGQFTLRGVQYDALMVQAQLYFEDFLNEPFPADSFDPTRFAGLF